MPDDARQSPQDPPSDEQFRDAMEPFTLECPECKRTLTEYASTCRNCGANLLAGYSGTYRPPHSSVAKIVAWTLLVVFIGSIVAAFGLVLSGYP